MILVFLLLFLSLAGPVYADATVTQLAINGFGGTEDPNSVSFLNSAVASRTISGTTYQVVAYKSSSSKLVLGKRTLPGGAWTLYHYNGVDKTDVGDIDADAHHVSVVEIDADGLVHIAFDAHNTALQYRRSDAAIGSWTGGVTVAQSMLGTNETSISYPSFFRSPDGKLYFAFRDGDAGNGDQYMYVWDDSTDTWAGVAGTTAGKLIDGKASSHSAYLNGSPKFTSDWDGAGTGFMHMSWMWADAGSVADREEICHVRWDGTNWTTIGGSAQTVPITKANADIVWDIGPSIDLLNQVDFDLTSNGRPVVGVIKNDGSSVSQLYALYYDGAAWQNHQITNYASGTWTDWGRPIVLVDRDDNTVYVIGGGVRESRRDVIQWQSGAGNFTSWTRKVFYSRPLYGGTELNYDRTVWLSDNTITGLITRRRNNATDIEVGIIEADMDGIDPHTPGGVPLIR